jgi:transcriptional regulator with XRE-family HTH domain
MANERLRRAILDGGFSTLDVAMEVGTDAKTVERWITNGRLPHPRNRAATARVLGVDELVLWPELAEPRVRAVAGSEVVHVYPHRGAVAPGSWYELLLAAEEHIDVLVFAGLFLADGRADLPTLLQAKADEGVAVRLLLGDPASEAVTRRGEEERVGDALAARIRLSMAYLEPVLNAAGVVVRLHDTTLYNSIYRFDADMLVNTHAYGAQAAQSPVMHLRQIAGGRLFPHYLESFEKVWELARPFGGTRPATAVAAV